MQHAAGFILFEDIRRYALDRIDPELPPVARAAAEKAVDDAIYGLMMVIDGVTGGVSNSSHNLYIDFIARLAARADSKDQGVVAELDLGRGEGMCMGFHGWRDGDFGTAPVASRRRT
jgi:hypothetical protein